MALIKCPACGNTISENAFSCPHCGEPIKKVSGEIVSGTETFHVEAGNRLALSAKVDSEVSARTSRLSAEGKNVINIQKSEPQLFSIGVSVWKMDVTMIWNASLDSPTYQQTIYNDARSYQSSGHYTKAAELYGKIPDYSDASNRKNECLEKINHQTQIEYVAQQQRAEISYAIGPDPSDGKGIYYLLWCIPMFVGFLMVVMAAQYYDLNKGVFWVGMIILLSSITACIIKARKITKYEQKRYQYEQSKKGPPPWRTNPVNTSSEPWKCSKCGEINNPTDYFCQSCGQYKDRNRRKKETTEEQ